MNTEGSISAKTVEQYVGINREYNVFELQKALGARNILQANKIVRYFMDNPKDAPMVMVVGNLYGFFAKIYQLSFLQNATEDVKIKALGLRSSWFLKDFAAALKNFPRPKLETIVGLLREFDLKSKGVNADGVNEGELLRELVYKILH